MVCGYIGAIHTNAGMLDAIEDSRMHQQCKNTSKNIIQIMQKV
jgi:hypothetical protein